MAQLTASLNTEDRGKRIVGGEEVAPSPIGALAKLGTSFLNGMDGRDASARANAAAKWTAEGHAAENATEQTVFDAAQAATRDLDKAKAASSQGRLPSSAVDLQLEGKIAELYNKFPDHKATIAKYLKAQNYDHWMFRDLNQNQSDADALHKANLDADTSDIKYAADHGLYNPNKTDQENVNVGRQLRASDDVLARLRQQREDAQKATAEGRTSADWDRTQNERLTGQAIQQRTQVQINSLVDPLDSLIAAAIGDPNKEKALNDLGPHLQNAIDHIERQALVDLGPTASKEMRDATSAQFKELRESVTNRFAGNLSSYVTSKRSTDNMNNFFGIQNGDSFPLYTRLSKLVGRDAVNAMFSNDPSAAFSPEIKKQIQAELSGFRTEDAESGRIHLSNLALLLKGKTRLTDMSEKEAMAQMPGLAAVARGVGDKIVLGDHSEGAFQSWSNAYGNILNATVEVQAGQRNLSPLWEANKVLVSPRARAALEVMLGTADQKEVGQALMQSSRGAAAHMLEIARDSNPTPAQFHSTVWNGEKFVDKFDEAAYQKSLKAPATGSTSSAMGGRLGPVGTPQKPSLDKESANRINIMNASIDHLVLTATHDPEMAGLTGKQIREHYAVGTPIVKLGGKTVLSSDQEFKNAVDQYEQKLQSSATSESTSAKPTSPITDIKFSDDRDAAIRTAIIEAGNQGPQGIRAVLSTMFNRRDSGKYGKTMGEVVTANNGRTWQYTAWRDNPQKGLNASPDSDVYKKIGEIYDDMAGSGVYLPYNNYINYDLQSQNGDAVPDWAKGPGTKIGAHTFF